MALKKQCDGCNEFFEENELNLVSRGMDLETDEELEEYVLCNDCMDEREAALKEHADHLYRGISKDPEDSYNELVEKLQELQERCEHLEDCVQRLQERSL